MSEQEEVKSSPYIEDNVITDDTVYGFVAAINESGYAIRFNSRRSSTEIRFGGYSAEWKPMNDREAALLREFLLTKFFTMDGKRYKINPDELIHYCNVLSGKNSVDPFREYLGNLTKWDGVRRLRTLFSDIFPGTDGPLDEFVARYLFLAPIYRAYQPGYKADIMPILMGPQGGGKSTFVEYLTPPGSGFFKEGVRMNSAEQKLVESILGAVHVEFGEVGGYRTRDIDRLKAFITRRNDDNVRLAFERRPDNIPRRCIFVGTTNNKRALPNDVTGNRRFIVVEVKGSIGTAEIRNWLEDNRDQLWAEAIHHYHIGDKIWLDEKQESIQATLNQDYRDADLAIEDSINAVEWRRESYTLSDIILFAQLVQSRAQANDHTLQDRVMRALLANKWNRKGGRWFPPVRR